jgi:hypothetical protein
MRLTFLVLVALLGCSSDPSPSSSSSAPGCAELCARSRCPNDGDCANQCASYRSTCSSEADAVIRCSAALADSDLECNAVTGTTQARATACATERQAYIRCYMQRDGG